MVSSTRLRKEEAERRAVQAREHAERGHCPIALDEYGAANFYAGIYLAGARAKGEQPDPKLMALVREAGGDVQRACFVGGEGRGRTASHVLHGLDGTSSTSFWARVKAFFIGKPNRQRRSTLTSRAVELAKRGPATCSRAVNALVQAARSGERTESAQRVVIGRCVRRAEKRSTVTKRKRRR